MCEVFETFAYGLRGDESPNNWYERGNNGEYEFNKGTYNFSSSFTFLRNKKENVPESSRKLPFRKSTQDVRWLLMLVESFCSKLKRLAPKVPEKRFSSLSEKFSLIQEMALNFQISFISFFFSAKGGKRKPLVVVENSTTRRRHRSDEKSQPQPTSKQQSPRLRHFDVSLILVFLEAFCDFVFERTGPRQK